MAHPEIDTTKPSVARMYDFALGGKDNFEADRIMVATLTASVGDDIFQMVRDHRKWSRKVVRWLAQTGGVAQFLDVGAGLPTMENTHEVAQAVNPDALVVYVDNDPTVISHGNALLAENDRTIFVGADLTEPDALLGRAEVTQFLDFDEPIGLIQCASIHHIDQLAEQQRIMAGYIKHLAPGSYVALTHLYDPADGSEASRKAKRTESILRSATPGLHARSYDEIRTLFGDLEFVPPGLVLFEEWWPDGPSVKNRRAPMGIVLGGVARKR